MNKQEDLYHFGSVFQATPNEVMNCGMWKDGYTILSTKNETGIWTSEVEEWISTPDDFKVILTVQGLTLSANYAAIRYAMHW